MPTGPNAPALAPEHLPPDPSPAADSKPPTLSEVATRAGVSPATVRRWIREGLLPRYEGVWTAAAAAHVRVIARLRSRGYSLRQIHLAAESGRLALGDLEDFLPRPPGRRLTLAAAARESGLPAAIIRRLFAAMGLPTLALDAISDDDLQILTYGAAVLEAGFPLEALLQLIRVYGQSVAQIADAEVRLFHMYVHEPLMREKIPGPDVAQEMGEMVGELLPFAAPLMAYVHGRFLAHFVEQDIVGHMEADIDQDALDLGRVRVAIAFADLSGYTRLAEEHGDEEAVRAVESFLEAVERTLPPDARAIKTLGDEVMVVGTDPTSLLAWAVSFQSLPLPDAPESRIGLHYGEALYRDGDYYGREVNRAARVVARAANNEVLVTRSVIDSITRVDGLRVRLIGEVKLKGFSNTTELFTAFVHRP